jgi:AraC-like DNA-binding protein
MSEALHLKKTSKHGILDLWEVQLKNYTGELRCALPGLEFLVPPYSAHEIRKDRKSFKVDPQSVLVFNGSEEHTEQFVNTNASLKAIVIEPQYISNLCEPLNIKASDIEFNPCELAQNKDLAGQIQLLANLSDPMVNPTAFSLDCLTSEILITTLTQHKHSQTETFAKDANTGYFPGTMPRIKSVIHQNIENPAFNLDVLAKESGLSKFHLIRVFKKNVGASPAKYLSQIKIDLAKHWLLKSKKSILSIAMDLGFSDLSTFNKAFKKALGVSPSGFRAL